MSRCPLNLDKWLTRQRIWSPHCWHPESPLGLRGWEDQRPFVLRLWVKPFKRTLATTWGIFEKSCTPLTGVQPGTPYRNAVNVPRSMYLTQESLRDPVRRYPFRGESRASHPGQQRSDTEMHSGQIHYWSSCHYLQQKTVEFHPEQVTVLWNLLHSSS